EGRQEGRQEEAQRLLLRLLEQRFKLPVPTEVHYRLQQLSIEQLENLLDVALTVNSWEQLLASLPEQYE
ncbi:MAG: DUF4351 domain-containing protein, partial [Symploca sp. SIO2G7]|nr:DUF4351 domain-containing protein [Symploca sp. SIO2G7]